MTKKAVVVLSGGQDSTTCLFWAKTKGWELHAITFDYNQRHEREIYSASLIAKLAGVPHEIIKLGPILKGTSPLVNEETELEQYESHEVLPGGLEKTFVPMRNQLFLTIALNRAYVLGTNIIVTGLSAEDYGGYPDCRREFVAALEVASHLGTFTDEDGLGYPNIQTPLMYLSKKQTVELALNLPGCYEALAFSHTSYDGEYPPTGHDHATLLRAKGFEEAGVPDPLILRAHLEARMDLPDTPNYQNLLDSPYLKSVRWLL